MLDKEISEVTDIIACGANLDNISDIKFYKINSEPFLIWEEMKDYETFMTHILSRDKHKAVKGFRKGIISCKTSIDDSDCIVLQEWDGSEIREQDFCNENLCHIYKNGKSLIYLDSNLDIKKRVSIPKKRDVLSLDEIVLGNEKLILSDGFDEKMLISPTLGVMNIWGVGDNSAYYDGASNFVNLKTNEGGVIFGYHNFGNNSQDNIDSRLITGNQLSLINENAIDFKRGFFVLHPNLEPEIISRQKLKLKRNSFIRDVSVHTINGKDYIAIIEQLNKTPWNDRWYIESCKWNLHLYDSEFNKIKRMDNINSLDTRFMTLSNDSPGILLYVPRPDESLMSILDENLSNCKELPFSRCFFDNKIIQMNSDALIVTSKNYNGIDIYSYNNDTVKSLKSGIENDAELIRKGLIERVGSINLNGNDFLYLEKYGVESVQLYDSDLNFASEIYWNKELFPHHVEKNINPISMIPILEYIDALQ